ncbi:MAG: DegT/DnrJ/EryC1/StrS family aminotransferase [bacterium]
MNEFLNETPYIKDLIKYAKEKIIPFQCPGHKAGKAYHKTYKSILRKNLFEIETNEIPLIDTFQNPQKSLKISQDLMSKAYNTYKCYYIVGGSTISNHISIISSVCEKDKIVIPRNSHKSIFSGLILSGANPIFVYPNYDYEFNIDKNIEFEKIKEVVEKNDVSAVVITHPTYYGLSADIQKIAEYLHKKSVLLIVDQAWGSHFRFHPFFPTCSTQTPAHIIVMSPHKTLFAFTQSSILHLNHSILNNFEYLVPKINQTVLMLNSTSPSPLLFASLDYTQYMLNNHVNVFERLVEITNYTIKKIKQIDEEIIFPNDDKTKIVLNLSKYGLSGYELEQILVSKYRIQVEMSDLFNILILLTVGDRYKQVKFFINAIREIVHELKMGTIKPNSVIRKISEYPDWPSLAISPRQAYISRTREIPINQSIGKISAEIVTTYPPGIPILIPGEVITKQIADYILCEIELGTKITGINNIKERKIRVVDV